SLAIIMSLGTADSITRPAVGAGAMDVAWQRTVHHFCGESIMISGITDRFTGQGRWAMQAMLMLAGLSLLEPPPSTADTSVDASVDISADARAAHEIAVNAYIYLYPLITMDITRRQL